MSLLDVALSCVARGWHVFPCKPRAKEPLVSSGFKAATNNEAAVREWWSRWPDANVGIATGASGLTVLDCDHGINGPADVERLRAAHELPETFTVRTGRRPEYGVQLYFKGDGIKSIPWKDTDGDFAVSGDIRGATGYVLAAGSVHPSGERYETLTDAPIAGVPAFVRSLRSSAPPAVVSEDALITEARNSTLTSFAGKLRNAGASAAELEVALLQANADRCVPPLGDDEVRRIAANVARYANEADPVAVLGKPVVEVDPSTWPNLFHSRQETEDQTDPKFLIAGFLQEESVTGLIGPARARKSIVTLNVIHSLLTGEKLFGHFDVPNKPERVVYLCPESGLKSLARRIRNMDLARFIGDRLFYTSMNSDPVSLEDVRLREAVKDAVVIVDTAIRFFDGDENSSQDMKRFGAQCHELIRIGVRAVILLHHNSKGAEGLTLEGGRGSGDFGGFLTCCWGTTLDDYEDAYKSESLLSCVKQRDFRADSFKVAPSGDENDFFLQYVSGSENAKVVAKRFKGNRDGKDETARAFIKANIETPSRKLVEQLKEHGISRGRDWVMKQVTEFKGSGSVLTT